MKDQSVVIGLREIIRRIRWRLGRRARERRLELEALRAELSRCRVMLEFERIDRWASPIKWRADHRPVAIGRAAHGNLPVVAVATVKDGEVICVALPSGSFAWTRGAWQMHKRPLELS